MAFLLLIAGGYVPESSADNILADPTRPPDAPAAAPGQDAAPDQAVPLPSASLLRVSAIILGLKAPHAIINGVNLTVGDSIAGYEVKAINRGRVTLRRNDEDIELGLSTATQSVGGE